MVKPTKLPRARHVWSINPKSRIRPSKKKDVGTRKQKNRKQED